MAKNWRKKLKEKVESSPDYTGYRATTNDAATKSTASTPNSADWRQKIKDAVNDGSAAKKYQERYSNGTADALIANNPAYVYTKAYGDGKTGVAANKQVKGTATPRSRFEPADTGRPLGRASAQRAFTSTPTGNFKGEAVLKSALSSTGAAYKKLGADVTSSTGNLSMGESARTAIDEAKAAKKEGRQVKPGQAQRKAEQDKVKSFNDGWAGDFKKKLLESAEESSKRAYEYEQEAKEGLGKFGQGVVDFGIAGAQFAGDALLNAVAPGTGLAAMAGRAYGSASLDAQQRGLSEGEQQISGLKSAAIEMLTEKLFGSVSKVAYGKGIIKNESLVNSLVNRLAKTDRGRTALKVLVGANEEGLEEVLSDILNPIADRILKLDDGKGDWSDLADDFDTQQMLEDYIIGGALGLAGAGTNVVSGQYRAENAQQRAYEEYQRQLVNAGLATEQGGDAQLTAEKYRNILNQSTQRGKRNLSDKETENLERLIRGTYAQEDASDVSTRLAQLGTDASEQTVNAIVKAVNGETLSRAEQKAFDANPYSQRVVNEMLDTEGVTSNEWYADRASAQSFTPEVSSGNNIEQAQNVLAASTANNPQFVNSMALQYEVAPEVVERTYNLNPTAPQAFATAFNAVYQMGQQGTDKAALSKVPVLNTAQANIAYQMGADSVMSTETAAPVTINNTQEVNENGVRIHNVAERINGQNTEGQIRGVETGAGENVAGGSQKEQSGAGAAQIKAGEKVSYKSKQQKGVYYAVEDTEDMKKGRKLAESYGYKVRYFVGGNIRYAGGEFRGVVDTANKTVMVRADHPDYTADQIMRHEMGHAAFENGDLSIDEAREMLLDDFTADEINELIEIYNNAYGGILSTEEAFEEICCDALGRINIFEGTDLNSESYGKAQDTVRKYAAEKNNSKGRAPPKKGGVKYSLEGKNKYGIEVYTTSEEVRSLTRKERQKKFLEIMQNEYRGRTAKFNRNGHTYYATFDENDIRKNIYGDKRSSGRGYNAKLKVGADGNIFELVENSKYDGSKVEQGKNIQAHKQVRYWDYFVKTVQIDNEVFDLLANVRRKSAGDYVYSIQLRANKAIEASAAQQPSQKAGINKAANASENSIRSSSENVNEKFSREPEKLNELRRQNEELKQRVEYWKNQTKPTITRTVRKGDIQKLAREIIDMSDTDLKPGDITESLNKLGEYILNEPELRYTDVAEMANSIASEVIENATAIVNEGDVEIHNDLKDYLKRVKFRDDGSTEFASVRRNYKRRIMFDKNGLGVDTAYAELHDMFGEGFFPEDIINPGDMLERIAEVLDGTAPQYANPNGYYAEEAAEYMRNYIIDSMLSDQVRQTAPTMADKAAAREAKLKADNAERIKNAVKKERERNEVKLQRFKEGVARLDSKRKETALKNRYRGQIEKNVNTLSKWLLNPDHKNTLKHIPGQLQSTVRDFISAIDFTSSQQLGGGAPTIKDMKYIDSLDRLRRYIADSKVGEDRYSDLDLPPEFETQLADFVSSVNTLARNNKGTYTINDMTSEQLKELSDIVKTMKKAITDMNRLYQNATFQHVYEAGESDIETLREYTKTKAFTSKLAANRLDQAIMWESSRPAHVFKRFGKGGESMYQEFVDGQNTMAFLTKEVIDFAEDTYTTAEVKQWAKETHEFKFGDQRVKLTSAQLMSLYELNKRSQAKQHLDSGGFRVANFKDGKFNLQTDKEKHVFTDTELNEMFGELTGRQKEVADKLQHFMVERGGEWGNYVSRKRFDVEMFKDENYFPIKIDTTETDSNVDEKTDNASLYQLLNMGFTKETSAKANQSIVVYDIFDVFANHMSEMAQYRSFVLPLLDMTKWFNIKVRDESGNVTASLRTEMRKAFGSDKNGRGFAEQFVTGIIKAYNGAEGRGDSSVNSRMINRVNRAAVAYNTRVMIQQPSAIVRAALYLDPKDLISSLKNYAGISTKQNIEEMHKHSGIALWKDLGFYDVNVSRGVQELIKHSQGTISKINEIGMKGAEFADKVTWAALWDASKKQVRRETGLSESDAEFFPKVSKVFENVIYNTQVVDTVLTKSEVSRNRSSGARLFTSFMSEPMTTASLVTSEIFDIQMKQAKGIKLKPSDYSRLSKTCIVVAVAAVVNSALASLADAWRDDDEYGTFGQKWTRAMRIKLADELNPLTYLPYASNVWDVTKAFLDWTDTKWFGVEVYGNGTDIPFADILESTEKAVKIFGEIREKGEDSKYTKFGGYYKVVNVLSKITGIPLYNIAREGVSLYNTFASDKIRSYEPSKEGAVKYAWNDGYLTDDEAIAALQDDAGMDEGEAWLEVEKWKNDTTSNYTKLYDAIDNGGDIKKAVDELTEHGVEEKNIKSSLTRRYKDAYINGDNKEREKIRRALYATGVYGSVNEVIEKCNSWLKK